MNKLNIECEYLAAIPTGLRVTQHVILNPTDKTKADIREALKSGGRETAYTISITDKSGEHTSTRLHIPITCDESYGNLILTTVTI